MSELDQRFPTWQTLKHVTAPIGDPISKTLFADEAIVLKMKVVVASGIGILDKTNDAFKKTSRGRGSGDERCYTVFDLEELHAGET